MPDLAIDTKLANAPGHHNPDLPVATPSIAQKIAATPAGTSSPKNYEDDDDLPAQTPRRKRLAQWPVLSFEQFVVQVEWSKRRDEVPLVLEKYNAYKKDHDLTKPLLDTLARFSTANQELFHQMAHAMLSTLSIGQSIRFCFQDVLNKDEVNEVLRSVIEDLPHFRVSCSKRSSTGDPTIVSCLAASTRKASAKLAKWKSGNEDGNGLLTWVGVTHDGKEVTAEDMIEQTTMTIRGM